MSVQAVLQHVQVADLRKLELYEALEQTLADLLGPSAAGQIIVDDYSAEDILHRNLLGPPEVAGALLRHAVVQRRRSTADLPDACGSPRSTLSFDSLSNGAWDSCDSESYLKRPCRAGLGSPYGSQDDLYSLASPLSSLGSSLGSCEAYEQHLLSDDDDASAASPSRMGWALEFKDAGMERMYKDSLPYTSWAPSSSFNKLVAVVLVMLSSALLLHGLLANSSRWLLQVLIWASHVAFTAIAVVVDWRSKASWRRRTVLHAVLRVLRLVMTCWGAMLSMDQDRCTTPCSSTAAQTMLHSVAEANLISSHVLVDMICLGVAAMILLPNCSAFNGVAQLGLAACHGPLACCLQLAAGTLLPTLYIYQRERRQRLRFVRRFLGTNNKPKAA